MVLSDGGTGDKYKHVGYIAILIEQSGFEKSRD